MAIRLVSAALHGVDALPIEIEVDLLRRLPGVSIVGLASGAVRESAERVRSAVSAAGLEFPKRRVVVNLAPAGVRKDGAAFDLPIALGILAADGQVPSGALGSILALGELSLDGSVRDVRGAVSIALLGRELGKVVVLPPKAAAIARCVPGVDVRAAATLSDVLTHLAGGSALPTPDPPAPSCDRPELDLADVRGQHTARRALEIAAAGAHHLLLSGPPGCGKSMLAQRLPSILPPLSREEALEVTRVHAARGGTPGGGLVSVRPFRAPHHSATAAAMTGDHRLRPGEVALAHHGVLFLDEAPEFRRPALESLRAPLEDGRLVLSRASGMALFPARVLLVLAANPCPCGYRGSASPCRCTDRDVDRYQRRLSGPILDRIDLHVALRPVEPMALLGPAKGESSADVRARVCDARQRQLARDQGCVNAALPAERLHDILQLQPSAKRLLDTAIRRWALSARGVTRLLRVARTVADLAQSDAVADAHLVEAMSFRRTGWGKG